LPVAVWLTRSLDVWYRWRFAIAVGCLTALGVASLLTAGAFWPLSRAVPLGEPHPQSGFAYVAPLSRPELSGDREPLDTFLYEVHIDRGAKAFDGLNQRFGWSLVYLNLRARILARNPNFAVERRRLLGPGNQHTDNVAELGGGRYFVYKGKLYFSASDNSSPRTNGRRYELFLPLFKIRTMSAAAAWLRFIAGAVLALTVLRALAERRIFRPVIANTAPGLLVTVVMLAVTAGAFEIYQRVFNRAFGDVVWPMRFDAVAGLTYAPHTEIRWSNQLDFWTRERTNSLGFLDREPAQPKPPGRFRVLLVGDSFVEAAQVTNEEKVQTLLARKLDAELGAGTTDVVAIGLSGTGQANQLGLYEAFGKQLAPDLVVLVAVSNDFADNSALLSAVRNGWSPARPPWLFFEREATGFRKISPAEDWARHKLPGVDPAAFYAALRQMPVYAPRLAGWSGPSGVEDLDAVFWRRRLPPAFEDAIALTRRALEEWKAVGERDGFRLTVVATSNLTRGEVDALSERTLYLERFRDVVRQVGVPFLDLHPVFASQPDPTLAVWRHDSHWSRTGHQWAADALHQFLTDDGLLPMVTQTARRK
jgi:hypothetical protein